MLVAPWQTVECELPCVPADPNAAALTKPIAGSSPAPSPMISQRRQRWISIGVLAIAVGFLALAAIYSGNDSSGSPRAAGFGASASDTTLASGIDTAPAATQIIEDFLPQAGEASACREPVGVDLVGGYGARLTINGIEIAPEEMNVNLDDDGEITNVLTATRTLGHYTFQPTDECPNGRWLRPTDNLLEVCVFRFDDPAASCALRAEYSFDSL